MENMESKMYTKPQFRCAICNNLYDEIEERMNCERVCLGKQAAERKKRKEDAMRAEKEKRYKEVCDAMDKADELMAKYLADYHEFTRADSSDYDMSAKPILEWFGLI